jgi:putative PIN family toxin of toxin-antitoxin system
MRAVLDANVLLSALLWRGSPHRCLLAAEAGLYELALAEGILLEVKEKLIAKFDNTPEEAEESLAGIRRKAVLVQLGGRTGWVPADPDDDKIVETALISASDVIVSGDHHLLDVGTIEGIPIISPREFLDRLAAQ